MPLGRRVLLRNETFNVVICERAISIERNEGEGNQVWPLCSPVEAFLRSNRWKEVAR
jgi:hypothetical protein